MHISGYVRKLGIYPVVLQSPGAPTELEADQALQEKPRSLRLDDKYILNILNKGTK